MPMTEGQERRADEVESETGRRDGPRMGTTSRDLKAEPRSIERRIRSSWGLSRNLKAGRVGSVPVMRSLLLGLALPFVS